MCELLSLWFEPVQKEVVIYVDHLTSHEHSMFHPYVIMFPCFSCVSSILGKTCVMSEFCYFLTKRCNESVIKVPSQTNTLTLNQLWAVMRNNWGRPFLVDSPLLMTKFSLRGVKPQKLCVTHCVFFNCWLCVNWTKRTLHVSLWSTDSMTPR